ncbi:MAG: hypothetical protein GXY38_01755 [Planctomycetes bacterium]|nr:hypothetical protein [Planctomycetota bacterium]
MTWMLAIILSLAAAESPACKEAIIVLDFACQDAQAGSALADSIRLRLARHEEWFVLDKQATMDLCGPLEANAPVDQVARLAGRAGCNSAIVGTLDIQGDRHTATVTKMNFFELADNKGWTREFVETGQRARPMIARRVVEALRESPEWIPPQYGDEAAPEDPGKPVNVNGDFENGAAGWDRPDNAAIFHEPRPGGGNCIRIRTDLARDPWLQYSRALLLGSADPEHPPQIATDTSYGSVAGLEGVHYRSEFIKAQPGRRYWLSAEVNGSGPKIFVKGFRDCSDQAQGLPERSMHELQISPAAFAALEEAKRRELIVADAAKHPQRYLRECYRWYLNFRTEKTGWVKQTEVFPPRGALPENVQWLQVQIYAYWPPGTYYFDNVHLYIADDVH